MLVRLPDPPKSEPLAEGQPTAKKQKVTFEDPEEEDWEAIEKPDGSSINGFDQEVGDPKETAVAQEPAPTEQAKVDQETTLKAWLGAQEGGGNPPQNSLQKDW